MSGKISGALGGSVHSVPFIPDVQWRTDNARVEPVVGDVRPAGGGDTARRRRNVVRFPLGTQPVSLPAKRHERVLLLQGPVGPFFRQLQLYLEENDLDCWRVTLNAGDRFFSDSYKRIDFFGGAQEWGSWFRSLLSSLAPDHVVLFGAERPAHAIARQLAAEAGVSVLCLEEGYVRPGFVTVERDGNNATSPVAGELPGADFDSADAPLPSNDYQSFGTMCRHGAFYYGLCGLSGSARERQLLHRRFDVLPEMFCWTRNYWRRFSRSAVNFSSIERLLEHYDGRYFLVPLQVAADSQLGRAAHGWNGTRLITEVLESFARKAPEGARLAFKIHPMARGHSNERRLILKIARKLGVESSVDVIDAGSIGLLTRHSAGMITINSTSGLSAIHHGVPLMVVGDALYAHESLAVCARGRPDFDAFWTCRHVAPEALRKRYLAWVRHACLKPGDFYARDGMLIACRGVMERLREPQTTDRVTELVRAAC